MINTPKKIPEPVKAPVTEQSFQIRTGLMSVGGEKCLSVQPSGSSNEFSSLLIYGNTDSAAQLAFQSGHFTGVNLGAVFTAVATHTALLVILG